VRDCSPCLPRQIWSQSDTGSCWLDRGDTIGVMPSDYVGTLTIESVNTVEKDYASAHAFPSQGVAVLPNGDVVVCDTGYGRVHILSENLVHKRIVGSLGGRTRVSCSILPTLPWTAQEISTLQTSLATR